MIEAVAVVGPTASGKTDLAISLAEAIDTEIISADSMQCYRGLSIGTGAPSLEQLGRVPHHFIGSLNPDQEMSAADFALQARSVVRSLNRTAKPAVVVGGSGLYVQALLDGLFQGPGKAEQIRERLTNDALDEGPQALYNRLQHADPAYAATIHPHDVRRIVRALEVLELTGRPFSALHALHANEDPLDARQFAIDFPRAALYARADARVDEMVRRGLLDEVRALVAAGFEPQIARLKPIGIREMAAHLRGEIGLDEALESMKMQTRRYAKRQLTWFRGDDRVVWLNSEDYPMTDDQVGEILRRLSL